MTDGINKTILQILPMLITAAIIGMFGMQITSLINQTRMSGDIDNLKQFHNSAYTKDEASKDWKLQDLKDTQQSERMNMIVSRLNVFEEKFLENPE